MTDRQRETNARAAANIYAPKPVGSSLLYGLIAVTLVGLAMMMAPVTSARADGPQLATIVIDAASGRVLSAMDADSPRYQASLTKLMSSYSQAARIPGLSSRV